MNKKFFIVLLALFCLAVMTVTASANQVGNKIYCNVDKDGCWINGEDGGQNYIMFWSEESRAFFMGDRTAPYTNVTVRPMNVKNGELPLNGPNGAGGGNGGGTVVYVVNGKSFGSRSAFLGYLSESTGSTCSFVSDGEISCR